MPSTPEEEPQFTPREKVARFDPYNVRKAALEKEAASLESQAPSPTPDQKLEGQAELTQKLSNRARRSMTFLVLILIYLPKQSKVISFSPSQNKPKPPKLKVTLSL